MNAPTGRGPDAWPSSRGAPVTHLLYLHGFRSSPQSTKAQRMAAWMAAHRPDVTWWCPALPPSPAAAMALLRDGTMAWPTETMAVIGSSLGGFYATVLAQARGCRAVLLNPAVDPARDLSRHIGEHTNWHDPAERFFFRAEYVDELRAMTPTALHHTQRTLAIIAKGDEVLDWREMAARHAGSPTKLLPGGDHALSDFDDHLGDIVAFLQLA